MQPQPDSAAPEPQVRLHRGLLWGASAALLLGIAAVVFSVGIQAAVVAGFLMALAGPLYALAVLVSIYLQRAAEKNYPPAPLSTAELSPRAYRAGHFATATQVLVFIAQCALLVLLLAGAVLLYLRLAVFTDSTALAFGADPVIGSAVPYWNVVLSVLVTLVIASCVAATAGFLYHYDATLRTGERWALTSGSGAARLIVASRRVNLTVVWIYAALSVPLALGAYTALLPQAFSLLGHLATAG